MRECVIVSVRIVWNSDIRLQSAPVVWLGFASPFVLSTTEILQYFIQQNFVRLPHTHTVLKYVFFLFLFNSHYKKFYLNSVVRKYMDFCSVLL